MSPVSFTYLSYDISFTSVGMATTSAPLTNPINKRDAYKKYAFRAQITNIELI